MPFCARCAGRRSRYAHPMKILLLAAGLTETGARDLLVRVAPRLLKTNVDCLRIAVPALRAQALRQPEERPPVFPEARKVIAIDPLGLGVPACSHQARS